MSESQPEGTPPLEVTEETEVEVPAKETQTVTTTGPVAGTEEAVTE